MLTLAVASTSASIATYVLVRRARTRTTTTTTSDLPAIDHVVLLRLRDNEFTKLQLKQALEELPRQIPGLIDLTCGPTYSTTRANGFTHGLVARIQSKEALSKYAIHPDHLDVKALIIKAIQPLRKMEDVNKGTITLPPLLAVDYHSTRVRGTCYAQRSLPTSTTHIVLLCLRPSCHGKCASCVLLDEKLFSAAEKMAKGIPGLCDITFGRTFTQERSRGYTHCLNVRFVNENAEKMYQTHDLHQLFKKHLSGHLTRTLGSNLPSVCCLDWVGTRR